MDSLKPMEQDTTKNTFGHINKDVKRGVDDILTNGSIHPYLYFWSTWYAQQMGRAGVEMGGNVYFKDF